MRPFFRTWLTKRRARRRLVERDAQNLIERFGGDAYFIARLRTHDDPKMIDGNRPPEHWQGVRSQIARLTNRRGPRDWGGYSD